MAVFPGGHVATKRRRLLVTLTPETEKALQAYAAVSGLSPASFVSSILHSSVRAIELLTIAHGKARSDPDGAGELLRELSQETSTRAVQQQLALETELGKPKVRKRVRR